MFGPASQIWLSVTPQPLHPVRVPVGADLHQPVAAAVHGLGVVCALIEGDGLQELRLEVVGLTGCLSSGLDLVGDLRVVVGLRLVDEGRFGFFFDRLEVGGQDHRGLFRLQ